MYIATATSGDVPRLIEKMNNVLGKLYEPTLVLTLVTHWPKGCLVLRYGNEISGFLLGTKEDSDAVRILSIGVSEEFRGKGFGKKLLRRFISQCMMENVRVIRLEMATGNMAARHFYEKMGFTIGRRLSAFYEDGKDAFTMMRYV